MWPPPSRISATGKAFIVLVSLGFLFVFSLVFISVCVPELHKVLSVWGELWFLLFEWCRKTKSEQNTEKMKVGNSFSAEPGISEPFGSVRNILEISSPVFVSFFSSFSSSFMHKDVITPPLHLVSPPWPHLGSGVPLPWQQWDWAVPDTNQQVQPQHYSPVQHRHVRQR